MKLEDKVCSLQYAKKLKELGVNQTGYFTYAKEHRWIFKDSIEGIYDKGDFLSSDNEFEKYASAFTAAELGIFISYVIYDGKEFWYPIYTKQHAYFKIAIISDTQKHLIHFTDENESNVRAKMLIYLIEQGLVKVEDLK